jgi:hypothetical protein
VTKPCQHSKYLKITSGFVAIVAIVAVQLRAPMMGRTRSASRMPWKRILPRPSTKINEPASELTHHVCTSHPQPMIRISTWDLA